VIIIIRLYHTVWRNSCFSLIFASHKRDLQRLIFWYITYSTVQSYGGSLRDVVPRTVLFFVSLCFGLHKLLIFHQVGKVSPALNTSCYYTQVRKRSHLLFSTIKICVVHYTKSKIGEKFETPQHFLCTQIFMAV
jgi:hypothetical protein